MSCFKEYNSLLYGETLGWLNGRRVIKELTQKEYRTLLSLVNHRKTRLRWSAADRLGKIRDPQAIEPLIVTLNEPHWLVRLHAAKALGRIGEPQVVEPLLEALSDQCPYVRRRVVTALGQFSSRKAIQALISALKDEDKDVCIRAITSLGNRGSLEAISAISKVARNEDSSISWTAMYTFQRIGPASTEALVGLANDANDEVRYRAIKTLGIVGDSRVVPTLTKVMNDPKESARLRSRAKMSLARVEYWYNRKHSLIYRESISQWIRQWWPLGLRKRA